jgi:regulator of sigma E protease
MMLTLVAFIVAIGVLVAIHEYGHYAMAVACRVKVLRFSVGFGPRAFGWTSKKSGTEFVVSWLPLGGYVKMLDEREGEVPAAERHLAFNVQPVSRRAAIVAAGPVANLLLAILLYAVVNWSGVQQFVPVLSQPLAGSLAAQAGWSAGDTVQRIGYEDETLQPLTTFDDLRWWMTRAALAQRNVQVELIDREGVLFTSILPLSQLNVEQADATLFQDIGVMAPYSPATIGAVSSDGAAAAAGVQEGDRVVQVNQTPVVDAAQLRDLIRRSAISGTAQPQSWLVERQGRTIELTVQPKPVQDGEATIGRVGAMIGAVPASVWVHYGFIDGIQRATVRTWEVSVLTLKMMGKILIGEASLKNLSGPITIADYAGKSAALGLTPFLLFLAVVSISLGVLNLLPLPVLDGGHLMYYLWESVTGKAVSELWMERLQRVGISLLMLMMSIAVFNDVARLVG